MESRLSKPLISTEQALKIAHETPPHDHNIINHKPATLRICAIGCHGEKGGKSKQVMTLLNDMIAKHPELKPDIILILGDNYYRDGLPHPTHPKVQEQFYDVFADKELKNICDIPCKIILGNHDSGQDAVSEYTHYFSYIPYAANALGTNPHQHIEAELQQVAHTYLFAPDLFNEKDIDYSNLPKHCMPSRFHKWGYDTVQLIGLNTNTYPRDFLRMMKDRAEGKPADPTNQAVWLKEKHEQAKEKSIIYATHHPFFTFGKHFYPSGWDGFHYITPEEITLIRRILQLNPEEEDFEEKLKKVFAEEITVVEKNTNYSELLADIIYKFQKLPADIICSAHDHFIKYYNNKIPIVKDESQASPVPTYLEKGFSNICQIGSGGGGSTDIQPQTYFGEECHFTGDNGFTLISCDKNNPHLFHIDIHSLGWAEYLKTQNKDISIPQLSFTSDSNQPIRQEEVSKEAAMIRNTVLEACAKYENFLHQKQGVKGDFFPPHKTVKSRLFNSSNKHSREDIDRMHEIKGFFNSPVPFDYEATKAFLNQKLEAMPNKDEDSLYYEIQKRLKIVLNEKTLNEVPKQTFF